MNRSLRFLATAAVVLLASGWAQAQFGGAPVSPADTFEMGWRNRAFEALFEDNKDAEGQKRAIAPLKAVFKNFFSPQRVKVAEEFDKARFAIQSPNAPEPAAVWGASLSFRPATRLLELGADALPVKLAVFYETKAPQPQDAVLRLTLWQGDAKKPLHAEDVKIVKMPTEHTFSLKGLANSDEGDFTLRSEIHTGGKVVFKVDQTLSLVARAGERLAKLGKAIEALPQASIEKDSAKNWHTVLSSMLKKELQSANYNAVQVLAESEAAVAARAAGKNFYGADRPGSFWLTVPTEKGAAPIRMFVPESVKKGQPVPLVFALHGAGGNESWFFEIYNRKVLKMARDRGWMLVSTRSGTGGKGGGPPVVALIDELAKRFPVDRQRVFVMGHSMGAAQSVGIVCATPERFAAVAPVGGSGTLKPSEALKDVAFFIGCGSADTAITGARNLSAKCKEAGIKKSVFREYKDVEHVMIPQAAAADIFAFFDEVGKTRK